MKRILVVLFLAGLLLVAVCSAFAAPPNQVLQGTQMHLTLLNSINTAVAREGDPIVAAVAEPVYLGSQLLVPAGTRINGVIGTIERARHFSMFRGQAYINLTFRTMEVDSRLIPVRMSIVEIEQPHSRADAKRRKDVKVDEGQVIEEKHDVKGDVMAATIGAGGGTLAGAVFSNVVRGFGIGLAGSAAYVVARKGKEVDLPAQTGMLVRLDNTVNIPVIVAGNGAYAGNR
ncbi:MAG TPA: hypothetical protein VJN42_08055 [Candidatus Acidoferrum sp.]|nr:hypothetical protein [Candidatus Acidoferrum sp.]